MLREPGCDPILKSAVATTHFAHTFPSLPINYSLPSCLLTFTVTFARTCHSSKINCPQGWSLKAQLYLQSEKLYFCVILQGEVNFQDLLSCGSLKWAENNSSLMLIRECINPSSGPLFHSHQPSSSPPFLVHRSYSGDYQPPHAISIGHTLALEYIAYTTGHLWQVILCIQARQ